MFHYFDKTVLGLSATSCTVTVDSFASVIWRTSWNSKHNFSLVFSVSDEIAKKPLKTTRKKAKETQKKSLVRKTQKT